MTLFSCNLITDSVIMVMNYSHFIAEKKILIKVYIEACTEFL